ncbi:uncharacterized protein TRAVEDRAFT_47609 [Trametes versicolor FP-101664 SS1]|uniref:uncharacterized protein n=1 Tax=Trametes versicolor (strain FP-101664) TaxID=717944 RepID=UPI0004623FA0|nr:uncharacterized protein TRAVEDRAFT_47609 [Trametes versicolor FP-101664 SS1]EIW58453.1 hypothetical protein TRAVEDRAFT_47609 [Trametes versicolor FP-101664 SS1]
MPEEVLRVPVYLELARHNSVQVNMLVEVVLAMSADGKFVQATATCDEVNPPFPRVGVSRHLSLTTDASIYVPSNIMYAPVYVVVRRIRGLILQTRIAIQLTFIEWLPGDRSTFEVIADIKLLTEGVMAATRCFGRSPLHPDNFPSELLRHIVQSCGIVALLALRKTNRDLYAHVHDVLRLDRRKLLLHYVPNPELLWESMDETNAVVGGRSALLFLLRTQDGLPATLDIYVSSLHGDRLVQLLEEDLDLHLTSVEETWDRLQRNVAKASTFTVSADRFITVHTSKSISPFDPIAMSPLTALINWVSPHAFACGYPTLTLRRRTLAPPLRRRDWALRAYYRQLDNLQFDIASEPTSWDDYAAKVPQPPNPAWRACLRQWFVCPSQGRFFGDAGSVLTMFDLVNANHSYMKQRHQAPYGVTVAWRILTSHRPCDGPCSMLDPIVPESLLTVPVVIVGDAFQLRSMHDPTAMYV